VPDRDQLLDAFAAGSLLRPDPTYMNVVDVVRGVASACGAELPLDDHARAIAGHLRDARHIVLVLADGLGVRTVDALPRGSWLRRRMLRAIRAPFPTTTPVAITSLATGEYPARHAVLGWWTHLAEIEAPVTVFAHERAVDGRRLDALDVAVETLLPGPRLFDRFTRDVALIMPEGIVDSVFTRWMGGTGKRIGYRHQADFVDATVARVKQADGPTFTYLYTPMPDTVAHEAGMASPGAAAAVDALDGHLAAIEEALEDARGGVRIVAVSDHGHLDIDPAARLEVTEGDELCQRLRVPPSGDLRTQYWHVKPGQGAAFEAAFRAGLGDHFLLLSNATVEELGLLGPGVITDATRQRMGQYLSVARDGAVMRYAGFPGRDGYLRMRSSHAGLTPAEVEVPLILGGSGFAR